MDRISFALALGLLALPMAGCSSSSASSSSDTGSSASGVCVGSGDHELGAVDRGATLAIAGGFVYIGGGQSASFDRVPVGGGDNQVIDSNRADYFAANDSGVVAWVDIDSNVKMLDASGAVRTLPKPENTSSTTAIAVDAAGNVFVHSQSQLPYPEVIWRFSPTRNVSDVLFKALGGVGPLFYKDRDGIAWIGPDDANVVVYHEDVEGGAPTKGITIPPGTNVIGLDASSVYFSTTAYTGEGAGTLTISKLDRITGTVTTAFATDNSYYSTSWAFDDNDVYWLVQRSDAATLSRAPKSGGTPEVVVTVPKMSSLVVGGCSMAYVSPSPDDDTSSAVVIARSK